MSFKFWMCPDIPAMLRFMRCQLEPRGACRFNSTLEAMQLKTTALRRLMFLHSISTAWAEKGHLVNFGKKWLVVSNRFKPAERIWDSDWERSSRICFERTSTSIWNSCLIKPFTSHQGLPWFTFCGWMDRMKCKIVGTARTWDVDPKRASSLKDMTNYVVSPLSLGLNICI